MKANPSARKAVEGHDGPTANPARLRGTLLVFGLMAGIFCAGCLPIRYINAHGASGRVVDAVTQAPLPNTLVSLTRPDNTAAQTRTSREGRFRIPAQHQLYIFCPGHAQLFHVPPAAYLTVEHDGYAPFHHLIAQDLFAFGCSELTERKISAVGQVNLMPIQAPHGRGFPPLSTFSAPATAMSQDSNQSPLSADPSSSIPMAASSANTFPVQRTACPMSLSR